MAVIIGLKLNNKIGNKEYNKILKNILNIS